MIGLRAAVWVLTLGLRLLGHDLGRRLLAALAIISVCAGLVVGLFTHPEPVGAEPTSAHSAARPTPPRTRAKLPAPQPVTNPALAAATPEQAAATWYSQHERLPRERVRVLQRDQVNATTIGVLVLGDNGNGRLDTALITVHRTGSGWQVQP